MLVTFHICFYATDVLSFEDIFLMRPDHARQHMWARINVRLHQTLKLDLYQIWKIQPGPITKS